MARAFELKKDGTMIDSKDVKFLIINGEEKPFSHEAILEAAKKTATIGAILNDGTKLNPSEIKYNIWG